MAAWKRRLPNALTCLRVLIAGAMFLVLARWDGLRSSLSGAPREAGPVWTLIWAAALFTLAAITDALDGMLARRWNVVSAFGRIMDPFADKVLVLGALIMMVGPNFQVPQPEHLAGFTPWMVVVILSRELLVTSIRAVLEGQGVSFAAGWSGKLKMILQSVAIPGVLVAIAIDPAGAASTAQQSTIRLGIVLAAWTTTIATVVSAVPYVARAMQGPRAKNDAKG